MVSYDRKNLFLKKMNAKFSDDGCLYKFTDEK